MLNMQISQIIEQLRGVKLTLDPSEEEAGKAVRAVLEGYRTGNSSEKDFVNECIQMATLKLHITSPKFLLYERRSIKKLLNQIGDGNSKQQKKQILLFLLDLLNKYGKSNASERNEYSSNTVVQSQDYRSQRVDSYVDREEVPPEEFKCPISLKLMYDPVVIDSGQTFERIWIQKWFDEGHDICPKTKLKLSRISLTPNTAMKDLISKWSETHGITVSDPCQFSADSNTWEHSSSSVNSLSSMYSLQLPVDYSNLSLSSMDNSQTVENTREFDEEIAQELDDSLPWEFQCKFVEDLMTRLKNDDRACKLISCENLVDSLIRFLKVARDKNDVKSQRIGCLLLLILVSKCRYL